MSDTVLGGGYRRTTTGMRAILWIGAGFVAVAGLNEYLLSSQTDRYFAWTIKLPLTAAFLGGFYLTAFGMAVLSARQREWSRARVGIPGVAVFLWLTLLATLLHLDLFRLHSGPATARVAAWAWLVIYIADPIALTTLWTLQVRVPGTDRPRTRLLPSWYWGLLGLEGGVAVVAGVCLFVALFFLQVIALIRYPHVVDWSSPSAWGFLLMLGGALVLGAAGWLRAQRRRPS